MSLHILITGANRGIGFEFVKQYLADGMRVFAAARMPFSDNLSQLWQKYPDHLTMVPLDVTSDKQISEAVLLVKKHTDVLDILINNAAIYPRHDVLGSYDRAKMLESMDTNAVSPILVGQAFLDLLSQSLQPKLVNISTQLGSFATNPRGVSPLYSASKAALNMYTRAFAREAKKITTVLVHPGWVKTEMGGTNALLEVDSSVSQIRALIERLTLSDTGQFFNYDGKPHLF